MGQAIQSRLDPVRRRQQTLRAIFLAAWGLLASSLILGVWALGRSLLGWDPERPRLNDLDWCYASDLEHLMTGDGAPALWLHGHIHCNRDYFVGDTRVVSNPRGYPNLGGRRENPGFDPTLIVELEPKLTLGMRK